MFTDRNCKLTNDGSVADAMRTRIVKLPERAESPDLAGPSLLTVDRYSEFSASVSVPPIC